MPRLPVDGTRVVEHRITLGSFERTELRRLTEGYWINRISTPIVALLSDVTGMIAIGALLGVLIKLFLPDWEPEITQDMTPKQLRDWLEPQNIAGMGLGALIGAFFGPFGFLLGGLVGGVAGGVTVEAGEEVLEYSGQVLQENFISEQGPTGFSVLMITLFNTIAKLKDD